MASLIPLSFPTMNRPMQRIVILSAVTLVAGTAIAQNNLFDFQNMGVTFTSRNGANLVPATIYNRIDKEAYAGWGVDNANPGMRSFTGLHCLIQDQDLSTQDGFSFTAYTESGTPNIPNTTTPLAATGNFLLPLGTGIGAYSVTGSFATPVLAPGASDVFVGVSTVGSWNATTTDGLSIWATSGDPTRPLRDEPGFGAPTTVPGNTYAGTWQPGTSTQTNAVLRQSWVEPIITTPAGVASALHYADPVHANANVSPGTVCMYSGQFPDSESPSRIAGRADDIGNTFRHTGIPDGTLVFFLADIALTFGPELPLSSFLPGSTGVVCVNLGSYSVVAVSTTLAGSANHVINIPAASRTGIAGLPVIQQAAAFDGVNGVALAGPCSKQLL